MVEAEEVEEVDGDEGPARSQALTVEMEEWVERDEGPAMGPGEPGEGGKYSTQYIGVS